MAQKQPNTQRGSKPSARSGPSKVGMYDRPDRPNRPSINILIAIVVVLIILVSIALFYFNYL